MEYLAERLFARRHAWPASAHVTVEQQAVELIDTQPLEAPSHERKLGGVPTLVVVARSHA